MIPLQSIKNIEFQTKKNPQLPSFLSISFFLLPKSNTFVHHDEKEKKKKSKCRMEMPLLIFCIGLVYFHFSSSFLLSISFPLYIHRFRDR